MFFLMNDDATSKDMIQMCTRARPARYTGDGSGLEGRSERSRDRGLSLGSLKELIGRSSRGYIVNL